MTSGFYRRPGSSRLRLPHVRQLIRRPTSTRAHERRVRRGRQRRLGAHGLRQTLEVVNGVGIPELYRAPLGRIERDDLLLELSQPRDLLLELPEQPIGIRRLGTLKGALEGGGAVALRSPLRRRFDELDPSRVDVLRDGDRETGEKALVFPLSREPLRSVRWRDRPAGASSPYVTIQ